MRNKYLILMGSLILCSCFNYKTFLDFPNAKWTYEDENISFYFTYSTNKQESIKCGMLTYEGNSYDITYSYRQPGACINFSKVEYDETLDSYYEGMELFYGINHVKDNICYLSIKVDNIFNGTITEMQLTYTPIED